MRGDSNQWRIPLASSRRDHVAGAVELGVPIKPTELLHHPLRALLLAKRRSGNPAQTQMLFVDPRALS